MKLLLPLLIFFLKQTLKKNDKGSKKIFLRSYVQKKVFISALPLQNSLPIGFVKNPHVLIYKRKSI